MVCLLSTNACDVIHFFSQPAYSERSLPILYQALLGFVCLFLHERITLYKMELCLMELTFSSS